MSFTDQSNIGPAAVLLVAGGMVIKYGTAHLRERVDLQRADAWLARRFFMDVEVAACCVLAILIGLGFMLIG